MKKKKFDLRTITICLAVLLIISVIIGLQEYFTLEKAAVNCLKSMILSVDEAVGEMEACKTDEEKEDVIYEFSKNIRKENNQLKELTDGNLLLKKYSLNELWRYVSLNRANNDADAAIENLKKLNEVIKNTGIYEKLDKDGDVSLRPLKDEIEEITNYCSGVISEWDKE